MDTTNARVDDLTTLSLSPSIDQLPLTIHTFSKNQCQRSFSFTHKTLHQIEQQIETCNALPLLKQYTLNLAKNYENQIQIYRQFLYNLWRNNACCSLCYDEITQNSIKPPPINMANSEKIESFLNQDMESDYTRQVLDTINPYQLTKISSETLHSPFRLQNITSINSLSQSKLKKQKMSTFKNWTGFMQSCFNFVSCSPKTFAAPF